MESQAATLAVRHLGDSDFSIEVRGHNLVVDQPREGGGQDSGPMPTELLVASLAVSVAFYGHGFLHRRGLADSVDVTAKWWVGLGPSRVTRIQLRVLAPGLPERLEDAFESALENCTVGKTLSDPPEIRIEVLDGSKDGPAVQNWPL